MVGPYRLQIFIQTIDDCHRSNCRWLQWSAGMPVELGLYLARRQRGVFSFFADAGITSWEIKLFGAWIILGLVVFLSQDIYQRVMSIQIREGFAVRSPFSWRVFMSLLGCCTLIIALAAQVNVIPELNLENKQMPSSCYGFWQSQRNGLFRSFFFGGLDSAIMSTGSFRPLAPSALISKFDSVRS